jgi:hypothetical protein
VAETPRPEWAVEEGDEAAAGVDNRVLVGVEDVDIVVPTPELELELDPETMMLPSRNGRKGSGVVLRLIWAGDRSGLLRKAQKGRAWEDECSVVSEMELVTSMGRSVMV